MNLSSGTTSYPPDLSKEVLSALGEIGLPASIIGTGGNCEAIRVRFIFSDDEILITNGDAQLPGYYPGDPDLSSAFYNGAREHVFDIYDGTSVADLVAQIRVVADADVQASAPEEDDEPDVETCPKGHGEQAVVRRESGPGMGGNGSVDFADLACGCQVVEETVDWDDLR